jgi:hypothetical protein
MVHLQFPVRIGSSGLIFLGCIGAVSRVVPVTAVNHGQTGPSSTKTNGRYSTNKKCSVSENHAKLFTVYEYHNLKKFVVCVLGTIGQVVEWYEGFTKI